MIDVRPWSFHYPDGRLALDRVELSVGAGEKVGLIGLNGAGKSTLLLGLIGVLASPPGTVTIAGLDPAVPAQRRQLPRHVGMVFQNPDDQLIAPVLEDEVAFGPLNLGLPVDEVRQRVAEALRQTGLEGFEQRVPMKLSGGEKRRCALAGILAMRPSVLLADEPTVFLDPRGRRELVHVLRSLPQTQLIASHDHALLARACDRVVWIDEGRVLLQGDTDEVLRAWDKREGT